MGNVPRALTADGIKKIVTGAVGRVGALIGGLGGLLSLPALPAPWLRPCGGLCRLQPQQWQRDKCQQAHRAVWVGWVGAVAVEN